MKNKCSFKFLFLYILFFIAFISSMLFLIYFSNYLKNDTQDTNLQSNEYPIIIIDAGHGGEDGGTIGINGIFEKDINLKISLNIYHMLKCSDIPVILTRDRDILLYDTTIDYKGRKKALDLAKRLEIAQNYENTIFISIHQNAFTDSKYSGLQVYYSGNDERSITLAQEIQDLTRDYLQPMNNRKCKKASSNIFLLNKITTPAVLVECGFLSNQTECELLSTDKYQKEISAIIYTAILNFLEKSLSTL